jgi:predicted ABC-type ATPase
LPELYIITGSNGAGKSTVGVDYLPPYIQQAYEVFDGDKLFLAKRKELYPTIARTHKEARNMANEWLIKHFEALVDAALLKKDHFVYEGHFSNDSTWSVPRRFKEAGYSLHLLFFGLNDQALSEMRVVERSKSGGHYVNPVEIDLNFRGNLIKLDQYFTLFNDIQIIDTSETTPVVLLRIENYEIVESVPVKNLPEWFSGYMPVLTSKIHLIQ